MKNVSKIILISERVYSIHKISIFQRVAREKSGSLKGLLSKNEEDILCHVFSSVVPSAPRTTNRVPMSLYLFALVAVFKHFHFLWSSFFTSSSSFSFSYLPVFLFSSFILSPFSPPFFLSFLPHIFPFLFSSFWFIAWDSCCLTSFFLFDLLDGKTKTKPCLNSVCFVDHILSLA